jgi:hypothetical protein
MKIELFSLIVLMLMQYAFAETASEENPVREVGKPRGISEQPRPS